MNIAQKLSVVEGMMANKQDKLSDKPPF